jgi:hypothetical protein
VGKIAVNAELSLTLQATKSSRESQAQLPFFDSSSCIDELCIFRATLQLFRTKYRQNQQIGNHTAFVILLLTA